MFARTVFFVAILAAPVGAQSNGESLWRWALAEQQQNPCHDANCSGLWLWMQTLDSECRCGPDCPCCHDGNCHCDNKDCLKLSQKEIYAKLSSEALKTGKPLLVSVKCELVKIDGCLSCRWDGFPDVTKGVVVGVTEGANLVHAATLDSQPTKEKVLAAVRPKPVPQVH